MLHLELNYFIVNMGAICNCRNTSNILPPMKKLFLMNLIIKKQNISQIKGQYFILLLPLDRHFKIEKNIKYCHFGYSSCLRYFTITLQCNAIRLWCTYFYEYWKKGMNVLNLLNTYNKLFSRKVVLIVQLLKQNPHKNRYSSFNFSQWYWGRRK